ncbi:VOC family protein [Prosthecobacter debontii]|uniref:VOC family protein n=1 Tax=Prosthecobacter debontii TaxID=48467 RepID=UPI003183B450
MMPPTIRLNLVVVRVADLERAQKFYEGLGLQFVRHRHGQGPEHLSAEIGDAVFELYPGSCNRRQEASCRS